METVGIADSLTIQDCAQNGIEVGLSEGKGQGWSYTALTDAQALELAHALVGMVMARQAGA